MKESYEINKSTCAIISINDNKSIVYEKNRNFEVNKNATKIIDESCKYFGSSLEGRQEGTKNIIKMRYKLPVIVEESNEIIFFPTKSPRQKDCSWISFQNVKNYIKSDNDVIANINSKNIKLDISYESYENQVFRAIKLLILLKERKIDKNKLN